MYEFNLTLNLPFEKAEALVRETLMSEHLGVVSEVNVQAIFKNKLDKEVPAYKILGACNPAMADRIIQAEPNAGTLLPCTFILRETGPETTVVSFMDPVSVLDLAEAKEVHEVAAEAREKLRLVVVKLQQG